MRFSDPVFLWLAVPAAALLAWSTWNSRPLRRGILPGLIVQALGAAALILAAAGVTVHYGKQRLQIAVAADVSDSIFELDAQTERIAELLKSLNAEQTQAAVVVFGANAGIERPMAPLSNLRGTQPLDLGHRRAVVKTGATDLAAALKLARTLFTDETASRAILVLSDFRETQNRAAHNAAALGNERIALLVSPALLSASRDVQLAEFQVPERAPLARAVPLEIVVASQSPAKVNVTVRRSAGGAQAQFVDSKIIELGGVQNSNPNAELRATVRLLDHPPAAGVYVYTATVEGATGPLPGDVRVNNMLRAAVRVAGPARWAVLARKDSTLDRLAADAKQNLGVEATVFHVNELPSDSAIYEPFAGVLVDGLSRDELSSAALHALETAAHAGKALAAIGGEQAFGAGGHPPGGDWERLLPIEMTPDDDRVRSILFLVDVSNSMNETLVQNGVPIRKKEFAGQQLQAVRALRPQDRLGLIAFSSSAQILAPLVAEFGRTTFLEKVRALRIESSTDLYAPLALAKEVLAKDDAREQLVFLLSDGVQTTARSREEVLAAARQLCPASTTGAPRRTTLSTFGIGVGASDFNATGESLLKDLAHAGGGTYSPDFLKLGEQLARTFEQRQHDFFVRRERFSLQAAPGAAAQLGELHFPELTFRNRVKAKQADVLLLSEPTADGSERRNDPLLIESGIQSAALGRRAALALSFNGADGERLLQEGSSGRTLLPQLLAWAEARENADAHGQTLSAEPRSGDQLAITLRAFDPKTGEPINMLRPLASLTVLETNPERDSTAESLHGIQLKLISPGVYESVVAAPPASVCRLTVQAEGIPLAERFVSTPCAAEFRRFGVDRAALAELVAHAGSAARVIETPRDLAQWAAEQAQSSSALNLRLPLLGVALVLYLLAFVRQGSN